MAVSVVRFPDSNATGRNVLQVRLGEEAAFGVEDIDSGLGAKPNVIAERPDSEAARPTDQRTKRSRAMCLAEFGYHKPPSREARRELASGAIGCGADAEARTIRSEEEERGEDYGDAGQRNDHEHEHGRAVGVLALSRSALDLATHSIGLLFVGGRLPCGRILDLESTATR